MKIELFAKKGIRINEIEILLGSDIKEAINALGKYEKYDNNYYFFGSALLLTTEKRKITEIEINNDEVGNIKAIFEGRDVFSEERKTLFPYLCQISGDILTEDAKGCSYSSDTLGIAFSYGFPENELEEYIREAKEDGVYEEMKEDIEKDIYRSKYLATFLIR